MHVNRPSRREALASSAAAALALLAPSKPAAAAGLALGYGVSEKDANAQLVGYGLPAMDKVRRAAGLSVQSLYTALYYLLLRVYFQCVYYYVCSTSPFATTVC